MHNFVGPKEWGRSLDIDFRHYTVNKNVTVLRPILFFHREQKTNLDTIKKYFTDDAILKLTHDKYIMIHD
jgi:hypothetical protein